MGLGFRKAGEQPVSGLVGRTTRRREDIPGLASGRLAMTMSNNERNLLSGIRVLVVEDDPLLLMDLEAILESAGAVVVGLCQTLTDAMRRSDAVDFSVAILDFRLGSDTVSPFARRLITRGVPFVLYTCQSRHEPSMAEWRDCSIVEKPAPPRALISAVREAVAH
jgi:DNA-binding NtrC family response regulator